MPLSLTTIAFLGIFGGLLILALGRDPLYGLYAYLFTFYNYPTFRWWGTELPEVRWAVIAALVTLLAIAVRPLAYQRVPAWYANGGVRILVIFTVWAWIQTAWALNVEEHVEHCFLFTKYIVLFYLIYSLLPDEKSFKNFAWVHVAGCLIFGWVMFTTVSSGRVEPSAGPGVTDANTVSMHLNTGLIFGACLFLMGGKIKRWLALISLTFILNGIILAASRGSLLGLVAGGLIMLYLIPLKFFRSFLVAGILGAILFSILSHDIFWDRMGTLWDEQSGFTLTKEASAASRIDIIKAELRMVVDYPFGAGFKGTAELSSQYLPGEILDSSVGKRASHNTVTAILVGQGIPGGICLIAIFIWIARELIRLKSLDSRGLSIELGLYRAAIGGSLTAYFVSGQTGNYLKAEIWVWLIALLAALSAISVNSLDEYFSTLVKQRSDSFLPDQKSEEFGNLK